MVLIPENIDFQPKIYTKYITYIDVWFLQSPSPCPAASGGSTNHTNDALFKQTHILFKKTSNLCPEASGGSKNLKEYVLFKQTHRVFKKNLNPCPEASGGSKNPKNDVLFKNFAREREPNCASRFSLLASRSANNEILVYAHLPK